MQKSSLFKLEDTYSFSQSKYSATEGSQVCNLALTRPSSTSRGLAFVETRSGTAGEDDFVAYSGPVFFEDGKNSIQFPIDIKDDNNTETEEEFEVVISPRVGSDSRRVKRGSRKSGTSGRSSGSCVISNTIEFNNQIEGRFRERENGGPERENDGRIKADKTSCQKTFWDEDPITYDEKSGTCKPHLEKRTGKTFYKSTFSTTFNIPIRAVLTLTKELSKSVARPGKCDNEKLLEERNIPGGNGFVIDMRKEDVPTNLHTNAAKYHMNDDYCTKGHLIASKIFTTFFEPEVTGGETAIPQDLATYMTNIFPQSSASNSANGGKIPDIGVNNGVPITTAAKSKIEDIEKVKQNIEKHKSKKNLALVAVVLNGKNAKVDDIANAINSIGSPDAPTISKTMRASKAKEGTEVVMAALAAALAGSDVDRVLQEAETASESPDGSKENEAAKAAEEVVAKYGKSNHAVMLVVIATMTAEKEDSRRALELVHDLNHDLEKEHPTNPLLTAQAMAELLRRGRLRKPSGQYIGEDARREVTVAAAAVCQAMSGKGSPKDVAEEAVQARAGYARPRSDPNANKAVQKANKEEQEQGSTRASVAAATALSAGGTVSKAVALMASDLRNSARVQDLVVKAHNEAQKAAKTKGAMGVVESIKRVRDEKGDVAAAITAAARKSGGQHMETIAIAAALNALNRANVAQAAKTECDVMIKTLDNAVANWGRFEDVEVSAASECIKQNGKFYIAKGVIPSGGAKTSTMQNKNYVTGNTKINIPSYLYMAFCCSKSTTETDQYVIFEHDHKTEKIYSQHSSLTNFINELTTLWRQEHTTPLLFKSNKPGTTERCEGGFDIP